MQQLMNEGYRLSPQQKHLWRLQQDDKGHPYLVQCGISIKGTLSTPILELAWKDVVNRFEILRTTFRTLPGMTLPIQVIARNLNWTIEEHNITSLTSQAWEIELEAIFQAQRQASFDLKQGPLFHVSLVQCSDRHHMFIITLHALCADYTTPSQLAEEIARSYSFFKNGDRVDGDPVQYADFSEWSSELLESDDRGSAGEHWRSEGGLESLAHRLPFERHHPSEQDCFTPATETLEISAERLAKIEALVVQRATTLSTLMLSCWKILIWRLIGQPEIVVGTAFDRYGYEELRGSLGLFVRYLPVATRFSGDLRLSEVLERVGNVARENYKWQDYFAWDLFAGTDGDLVEPFFPLSFDFAGQAAEHGDASLSFSVQKQYSCLSRFKLKLSCFTRERSLVTAINYDASLFSAGGIRSLIDYFDTLIDSVVDNPEAVIGDLEIMSAAERRRVIFEFNDTKTDFQTSVCAHELFERQAARTPNHIAVTFGESSLTYRELNGRANQLARHLRSLGIGPEVFVGIYMERSADMVVAILATLKAGGAYVPLDASTPFERLAYILDDACISVLLTQEGLADMLGGRTERLVCVDAEWGEIEGEDSGDLEGQARPDNLAYMIYTSGSSGRPKAVMIVHSGLVNYLCWAVKAYEVEGGEGSPVHSPLGFDLTVTSLWTPLVAGGCVELLSERDSIGILVKRMKEGRGYSLVKLTPAHMEVLGREMNREEAGTASRVLVIGGEALKAETLKLWRGTGTRLINEYGPTETVVGCSVYEVREGDEEKGGVAIGKPISNTRVYVVDGRMREVGVGVEGELLIGGAGVGRGYQGRAEETAERYVPDWLSGEEGRRLYRTGDVVRWREDGNLEYCGREDEQVKIRGYRIELGEIESVMREQAGVKEAVAAVIEGGERGKRLVGYVVEKAGEGIRIEELRRGIEEKLPEYMVPAEYVKIDEVPLTRNGKVDRRALPAPEAIIDSEDTYVEPRTLAEALLKEVWADVLGADGIGIDHNFFALGGDSILSIQVGARAQKRGLKITHQDIFRHQTIRELAAAVGFGAGSNLPAPETAPFSLISEADRIRLSDDVKDAYPLSKLQAGMVFHSEYSSDTPIFHDIHSIHLRAPFDPEALRQAIDKQIAHQDVMRTSFDLTRFSEPLQIVHHYVETPLRVSDLSHFSPAEQEEALAEWMEMDKDDRFSFARAPLLRFHVHRRSEDSFQFTLSFHHAILDGWSAATLLTDLFQDYWLLLKGEGRAREPLASSYRDFIALEQSAIRSKEAADYWAGTLSESTITKLPRRPRKKQAQASVPQVRVIDVPVSTEVSDGLKRLARSISVPLKSVLLGAHFKVMSVLSGQPDIVTGYTSHGRPERTDGERVLGLFLNSLPLRLKLKGGTWAELAQQTFEVERELLPYRWYPMAQIKNDQGSQQLFETAFTFLHYHVYQRLQDLGSDLDAQVLGWSGFEQTNFTLLANFHMDVATSKVRLGMSFDSAKLTDEQMDDICNYYSLALTEIAFRPDERYEYAELQSAEEKRQLLERWNGGHKEFRTEASIQELFEAQVRRTPTATALTFEGERLSYVELNERANQVAHRLRKCGIGPDVLVALCVEPSIEMVVGLLGILKSGGAYLPLDPAYPKDRLAFMLENAEVDILLTQNRLTELLPRHNARVIRLDSFWEFLSEESVENPVSRTRADNLAYVIYTSGSTGTPKGVPVSHSNVIRLFAATGDWFHFDEEDVWTLFHSYAFDFSVWELWGALLHGGRLVIVPYWITRTPEAFHDLLLNEEVTILNQTPSAFRQLMKADESASRSRELALRFVIFGGEALDVQSLKPWFARHGEREPELVNMYGITETTVHVTHRLLTSSDSDDDPINPIGVPIPDLEVYVLDQNLIPVPVGVAGELYVGGAGLARGYLNRPDLTAERFIPSPFGQAGTRLYKSGDLARFNPGGGLDYAGRIDHQIKIRGFRIELGEIESSIAQHPDVREVIVLARGATPADMRLEAYFVAAGEGDTSAADIRGYLKKKLPDYMVPSAIIELPALPMTANGKVDREKLHAIDAPRSDFGEAFVLPRTPVEGVLAGIWAQILGLERVSVNDNFFDLGGHSLLATQLISRVRETFQVELSIRALFDFPKMSDLAECIEAACLTEKRLSTPPILPVSREDDLPLSFAQQRLWFLHQMDPGSPAYNLPAAIRVTGALDAAALERTLTEIVRRHEILRTTFPVINGKPVQVVGPAARVPIAILDLSGLAPEERDPQAQWLATQEARKPFSLSDGPLMRVSLLRHSQAEHVILFNLHHIVADGWSMGVLVQEIVALYTTFVDNSPVALPELPIQYADFAHWQRQWLQGQLLETQLAYWAQQLSDAPVLKLPFDRPRPQAPAHIGAGQFWSLSTDLSERLSALAREQEATTFMVLLAAFEVLLSYHSRQDDIVIGTDIANRNRAETEGLIGFFVNQLVLRTDLSNDPTFEELVSRVRRVTLDAYAYQDLPFEKLVEVINPDRQGMNPLFQVKLILQNTPMSVLELPGLTLTPLSSDVGRAKLDLFLNLVESEQGLAGVMDYNADVFDPSTINTMLEQFDTIIRAIAQDPRIRLSDLKAALSKNEEQTQLQKEDEIEQLRYQKLKRILQKSAPELLRVS